jgi:Domain of unknown function (DUF4419)
MRQNRFSAHLASTSRYLNSIPMKKALPIFCALCAFAAFGQPNAASVTFPVCDVEKAQEALDTKPFREALEDAMGLRNLNSNGWYAFLQNDSTRLTKKQKDKLYRLDTVPQRVKMEATVRGEGLLVSTRGANAIAAAMVEAYAGHRPLRLSPDMIWLLLLQGLGEHIEADPEAVRSYFVDFQNEKTLEVVRAWQKGNPDNPWEGVFEEFGEKIAANTKNGLAETCLPSFSTTGKIEKAAFEVSLMRAMDPYFDYRVSLVCGIPEITLEGTPEDWERLEKHAAELARYGLDWWIDPLKPVLRQFSNASRGQVDTAFWQDMVKRRSYSIVCSTASFLNGWMVQLFPYIAGERNAWITLPDSVGRFETAFAQYKTQERAAGKQWEAAQEKGRTVEDKDRIRYKIIKPEQFGLPSLEVSDFPGGLSKANVILTDLDNREYILEFHAGCIGIRQDEKTMALRPEFGWIVLDKGLKKGQKPAEYYADFAKHLLNKK